MPVTRMGRLVNFSATEELAAHKIAEPLSVLLETYIDPYSLRLYPARGYWAHLHQDVQRFTGSCPRPDLPNLTYSIGSWDLTISQIAKGAAFYIEDSRGFSISDASFVVVKGSKR